MRNQPSDRLPSTAPTQSFWQVIVLTSVLAGFLIAVTTYSVRIWSELGDTEMSSSGHVALAIGVSVATALGAGLMGLVFYSSRRGYDDAVGTSASASDDAAKPLEPEMDASARNKRG